MEVFGNPIVLDLTGDESAWVIAPNDNPSGADKTMRRPGPFPAGPRCIAVTRASRRSRGQPLRRPVHHPCQPGLAQAAITDDRVTGRSAAGSPPP